MADEKVFLNEGNVFVSNSRIVISGTTYSTANITSVRKNTTPAKPGCALALIAVAALGTLSALALMSQDSVAGLGGLLFWLALAIGGIFWLLSLKPTHHVIMSSASGETQALSSQDEGLIDKAVQGISEAIVHRG